MEDIFQDLIQHSARNFTIKNYYRVWQLFNNFIIKLDEKPKYWEQRLALYGAYLADKGTQSSTMKSFYSAIKKILYIYNDGYKLQIDSLLLNTLT